MSEFPLSADETRLFHDQGYLGPFTAFSPAQMEGIRSRLEHQLFKSDGPFPVSRMQSRHLDNQLIYQLCATNAIVDRVSSLLGPDVVLWQSNFFPKVPGAKEIPWHQDTNYWANMIEPNINVSAWLAIDDTDEENSCVQLIPGSHRKTIPHIEASPEQEIPEQADPGYYRAELGSKVKMALKAGQFFLFNERTLHYSAANQSQRRRLGMAIRYTTPIVRVYKKHPVFLLRGVDSTGFNTYGEAPVSG